MNVSFAHSPTHTPAQAREVIAAALEIAAEHADAIVPVEHVFREACRLLGHRASTALMEQPVPFELPAMAIPRGKL